MLIPLVVVGTLGPASSEAVDTSVRQLAIGSLLFYLAAYSVATIGIFAALAHLAGGSDEVQLERLDQFAGLARTRPGMAAVLAILLLSLTGIPPTVGFWAKLHVLLAALTATGPSRVWLVSLVVIAAIAAVVAAGYCFRVIAVMYFRTPLADPPRGGNRSAQAVAIICAALVLALGLVGILARSVGYATLG